MGHRADPGPASGRAVLAQASRYPQPPQAPSQLPLVLRAGVPPDLESSQAVFLVSNEERGGFFFTVQLHFPAMAVFLQWS